MLKRTIFLLLLAVLIPLGVWAANVFIVDDSGNLTASGSVTLTAQEVNGDVPLANDETLDNSADSEVRFTYNDDAANLGELIVESENAAGNMADNDSLSLVFKAKDDGGNLVEWAHAPQMRITDVTAAAKDSELLFSVYDGNTGPSPRLTVTGQGLGLENGEIIANEADGEVHCVFDDDVVELGSFVLRSSVTGTENENYTELAYIMEDAGSDAHTFAAIRGYIDDRTNGSEDGSIRMMVASAGSEILMETLDNDGSTVVGTVDANAFTVNAGAGLDNQSAGALLLGASTATSVEIADAGVTTDIQGPVTILGTTGAGLDTAGATAMYIAQATATSLNLGASDIDTISLGRITVLAGAGEGLDTTGAGALEIGAATATSVDIADAGVLTHVQGPLGYGVNVSLDTASGVTCTADAAAATGVYGNHHYNNDNDAIKYTLPPVVAGMSVTIGNTDVAASSIITIEIDASDKIVLNGLLLDAGDTIDSPAAAGASITLIGIDGVRWNTINRTGTWTDGDAD